MLFDIREDIFHLINNALDGQFLVTDEGIWNQLLKRCFSAPLQYKINFIKYQETYFKDVYDDYLDISLIINRGGGNPVGIWPLCLYRKENNVYLGSLGSAVVPPLLPGLKKTEAQNNVYGKCLILLKQLGQLFDIQYVEFTDTVMSEGLSQWIKKLMQTGGVCCGITHQLFTDLSLSEVEIQKRTRRTNKYNISKGNEDYEVNVYDENTTNLPTYFSDFHKFHASVAGRETRNQLTWDIQLQGIEYGSDTVGRSFLIFIRDKQTKELAGAALFDTTFTHGLYCVAAYDRSRFSKPVGHVIQAYAMGKMRSLGIRWYEIGERPYITDRNSNQKIVDIGHYKEGFATHTFLKIYIGLSLQNSSLN